MDPTTCAIEFMKTVGADLHIRPKVEFSQKSTRPAPPNHSYRKRNEWIVFLDTTR